MYYVYVLYSKNLNKKYIGRCSDLRKRIKHHNQELNKWTKRGTPWTLVFYEAYLSKKDTILRETFLKSGRGREVIEKQISTSLKEASQEGSTESVDLKTRD